MSPTRKTILLIHGLWMTPRCWENFRQYYASLGHTVLAPPWPGMNGEVEEIRQDPSCLNNIGVRAVVEHYTDIIDSLPEPPVIIGHSFGGLVTQLLIDRGLGLAGVAIDSAPPKGILLLPWATLRATLPVVLNPAKWHSTTKFTFRQFWRAFANTLSEADAREAYERYAIPAPRKAIVDASLANFTAGSPATVNFRNKSRSPLLLIAGEKDQIIPASLNRSNFKKYRSSFAVTEFKEFAGRSHFIIGEEGWEEVARYALTWAESKTEHEWQGTSATVPAVAHYE